VGDKLCHGDFHPANILCTAKGPVIIDWSAATRGTPTGDVARTASLIRGAELPEGTSVPMRITIGCFRSAFHDIYVRRYFQVRGGSRSQLARWEPVQRVARAAWIASRRARPIDTVDRSE
jgi:aminoglycoside phosphotransferase (APT) family kinase protein